MPGRPGRGEYPGVAGARFGHREHAFRAFLLVLKLNYAARTGRVSAAAPLAPLLHPAVKPTARRMFRCVSPPRIASQ